MAINTNIDITADITSNFILGIFVTVLAIIGFGIYFISKNKDIDWNWTQLVSDQNGKGSLTRTLQLIGGLTGTFVVIYQTVKMSLMVEVFFIYMTALTASEAYSKYVNNKNKDKQE